MKCSTSRRVVDEVDNPVNLPYEAADHLAGCVPCREFAGERERLRKLLLEPARVSAPANFEAMVARRLAQRQDERRPFWLTTVFYIRAAGGAAALACLILAIQVTLFRPSAPIAVSLSPDVVDKSEQPRVNEDRGGKQNGVISKGAGPGNPGRQVVGVRFVKTRSTAAKSTPGDTGAIADLIAQPRALLLVRSAGSEREIAVPMVSVGAQPWLSVSLPSQDERGIRAAF